MSAAAHGDARLEDLAPWADALDALEAHLGVLRAGLSTPEGPVPEPFPMVPETPIPGVLVERVTRVLAQTRALEVDLRREMETQARALSASSQDAGFAVARPHLVDARI